MGKLDELIDKSNDILMLLDVEIVDNDYFKDYEPDSSGDSAVCPAYKSRLSGCDVFHMDGKGHDDGLSDPIRRGIFAGGADRRY